MIEALRLIFTRQGIAWVALCASIFAIVIHIVFPILVQALGESYHKTILAAFGILPLAIIAVLLTQQSGDLSLSAIKVVQLSVISILCLTFMLSGWLTEYDEPLELFGRLPQCWIGGFSCYPSYAIELISFTNGADRVLCIPMALINLLIFSVMIYSILKAPKNSGLSVLVICYVVSLFINLFNFAFVGALHV